ncbi:hypothetical protein [Shewanella woodyi]|uniref:Uncharacterized protein n=1 Tax=Shewanella woodyi (strain ATCC 51908 / MS32) TaxID=392500 RepID=B1KNF8_SHEWM|nr:hypothetical protein [Shewanella woodyi]ACA86035.1 conserved hypothetical protein [Shewanella woodyi ATCC 51908]
MTSVTTVIQDQTFKVDSSELLKVIKMSVVEKRQRLGWQAKEAEKRDIVGRWVDERDSVGDKITLYREDGKIYLETWYNDGCHSLDEMEATPTPEGLKLEDVGGNIFGEYFLLSDGKTLQFCNSSSCFYTAKVA